MIYRFSVSFDRVNADKFKRISYFSVFNFLFSSILMIDMQEYESAKQSFEAQTPKTSKVKFKLGEMYNLSLAREESIKTFIAALEVRKDDVFERIQTHFSPDFYEMLKQEMKWHKSCYSVKQTWNM